MRIERSHSKHLTIVLLVAFLVSCNPSNIGDVQSSPSVNNNNPVTEQSEPREPSGLDSQVTVAPPRTVGPGALFDLEGKPVREPSPIGMAIFDTGDGICTIGCWPALQPKFKPFLVENREFYEGAEVQVIGQDFVKLVPHRNLPVSSTIQVTPPVKSGPGIAYGNARGDLLLSFSDAPPPKEFAVIGQAFLNLEAVDRWRGAEGGVKVLSVGDERH